LYDTKNKPFIVSVGTDQYEKSIFKNKKKHRSATAQIRVKDPAERGGGRA
jgi:hypothetical protein